MATRTTSKAKKEAEEKILSVAMEAPAPKNKGGRPKGVKDSKPRKKTEQQLEHGGGGKARNMATDTGVRAIRKQLIDFLCSPEELQNMIDDIHAIENPRERQAARKDLLALVLPKVTAMDLNASMEVESVHDELSKLVHGSVDEQTAIGIGPVNAAVADEIMEDESREETSAPVSPIVS